MGPSGNFYASNINNSSIQIKVSRNEGKKFKFLANAFTCTTTPGGPDTCGFTGFDGLPIPDQPHIVVDRVNAGPGGDQIYAVWRHGGGRYGIVCSADSGKTWTAPGTINYTSSFSFPRITVGQDGFVYVVGRSGATVVINKYGQCKDNPSPKPLTGFPVGIVNINGVPCPMPGLDRCDTLGYLSSHTVAVDDTDANHVYLMYANNSSLIPSTSLGNDNIRVTDSLNGGLTWVRPIRSVNTAVNARRFFPWLSVVNGRAYMSWYDRRFATPAQNDLTDYFGGSAFLDTSKNLTIGPEFRISEVSDPQCGNFWPAPPISPFDAASCSTPQLAGGCGTCDATGNNCAFDPSLTRCDFKACDHCYSATHKCVRTGGSCTSDADCFPIECQCPGGEICLLGDGIPKYGDFNENTTSHVPGYPPGQLLATWASATSPPGLPPTTGIQTYFSIRPQADLAIAVDCPKHAEVKENLTCTVNVTNNGPDPAIGAKFTFTVPEDAHVVSTSGTCVTHSEKGKEKEEWRKREEGERGEGHRTGSCDIGDLANAESKSVTLVFKPTLQGTFHTTVKVTGLLADLDQSNNHGKGRVEVRRVQHGKFEITHR